ncbi:MAG TPA: hypothetical protein VGQ41_05700 [Pyrinomonadaceae bacterium]|nr:hypothetical protein [Pyrinomonadaceae bacterium]
MFFKRKGIARPPAARLGQRFALLWERPVVSLVLALTIYTLFGVGHSSTLEASAVPYYNYLADAFLHGQLHLRLIPKSTLDLSYFNGHFYLYWAPLPAVLLMPFVALFGVGFSDVAFTLLVAAANVFLVAILLRKLCVVRIARVSRVKRGILVLFFSLGTVHLTLAPFGRVWSTGQLVGFLCVILAYLASISVHSRWAFAFTGLAIAGAVLTRSHLIFAALWPCIYLWKQYSSAGVRKKVGLFLLTLLPILAAIALLGIYNWLRFGNILDNGIPHHAMHAAFSKSYQQYGAFNIHYVPINLFYQYIAYPLPIRPSSYYGGSLFLLSPVFVAAFWSPGGKSAWIRWGLLASIVLVGIPIALLMGTGWVQFGPRYTLDFTVPLLMLTAIGSRKWSTSTLSFFTLVSIVQYFVGTLSLMVSL